MSSPAGTGAALRARALVTPVAALALGVVLGASTVPITGRVFAVTLAVAAVVLQSTARGPVSPLLRGLSLVAVAAAVVVADAHSSAPLVETLVFGTSLILVTAIAPALVRDLGDARRLWTLGEDVLSESAFRALDVTAEREMARARRTERPLTVVSIDVLPTAGDAKGVHAVAGAKEVLADELRRIDVVGYVGGRRLVALLPETGVGDRACVERRIRRRLGDAGLRANLGAASFPDEEVTWRGLEDLARDREAADVSQIVVAA